MDPNGRKREAWMRDKAKNDLGSGGLAAYYQELEERRLRRMREVKSVIKIRQQGVGARKNPRKNDQKHGAQLRTPDGSSFPPMLLQDPVLSPIRTGFGNATASKGQKVEQNGAQGDRAPASGSLYVTGEQLKGGGSGLEGFLNAVPLYGGVDKSKTIPEEERSPTNGFEYDGCDSFEEDSDEGSGNERRGGGSNGSGGRLGTHEDEMFSNEGSGPVNNPGMFNEASRLLNGGPSALDLFEGKHNLQDAQNGTGGGGGNGALVNGVNAFTTAGSPMKRRRGRQMASGSASMEVLAALQSPPAARQRRRRSTPPVRQRATSPRGASAPGTVESPRDNSAPDSELTGSRSAGNMPAGRLPRARRPLVASAAAAAAAPDPLFSKAPPSLPEDMVTIGPAPQRRERLLSNSGVPLARNRLRSLDGATMPGSGGVGYSKPAVAAVDSRRAPRRAAAAVPGRPAKGGAKRGLPTIAAANEGMKHRIEHMETLNQQQLLEDATVLPALPSSLDTHGAGSEQLTVDSTETKGLSRSHTGDLNSTHSNACGAGTKSAVGGAGGASVAGSSSGADRLLRAHSTLLKHVGLQQLQSEHKEAVKMLQDLDAAAAAAAAASAVPSEVAPSAGGPVVDAEAAAAADGSATGELGAAAAAGPAKHAAHDTAGPAKEHIVSPNRDSLQRLRMRRSAPPVTLRAAFMARQQEAEAVQSSALSNGADSIPVAPGAFEPNQLEVMPPEIGLSERELQLRERYRQWWTEGAEGMPRSAGGRSGSARSRGSGAAAAHELHVCEIDEEKEVAGNCHDEPRGAALEGGANGAEEQVAARFAVENSEEKEAQAPAPAEVGASRPASAVEEGLEATTGRQESGHEEDMEGGSQAGSDLHGSSADESAAASAAAAAAAAAAANAPIPPAPPAIAQGDGIAAIGGGSDGTEELLLEAAGLSIVQALPEGLNLTGLGYSAAPPALLLWEEDGPESASLVAASGALEDFGESSGATSARQLPTLNENGLMESSGFTKDALASTRGAVADCEAIPPLQDATEGGGEGNALTEEEALQVLAAAHEAGMLNGATEALAAAAAPEEQPAADDAPWLSESMLAIEKDGREVVIMTRRASARVELLALVERRLAEAAAAAEASEVAALPADSAPQPPASGDATDGPPTALEGGEDSFHEAAASPGMSEETNIVALVTKEASATKDEELISAVVEGRSAAAAVQAELDEPIPRSCNASQLATTLKVVPGELQEQREQEPNCLPPTASAQDSGGRSGDRQLASGGASSDLGGAASAGGEEAGPLPREESEKPKQPPRLRRTRIPSFGAVNDDSPSSSGVAGSLIEAEQGRRSGNMSVTAAATAAASAVPAGPKPAVPRLRRYSDGAQTGIPRLSTSSSAAAAAAAVRRRSSQSPSKTRNEVSSGSRTGKAPSPRLVAARERLAALRQPSAQRGTGNAAGQAHVLRETARMQGKSSQQALTRPEKPHGSAVASRDVRSATGPLVVGGSSGSSGQENGGAGLGGSVPSVECDDGNLAESDMGYGSAALEVAGEAASAGAFAPAEEDALAHANSVAVEGIGRRPASAVSSGGESESSSWRAVPEMTREAEADANDEQGHAGRIFLPGGRFMATTLTNEVEANQDYGDEDFEAEEGG